MIPSVFSVYSVVKSSVVHPSVVMQEPDPIEMPITGELDLHTFQPRDLGSLLPDYLAECQKLGILSVRVIHGKGTGALREGVHRLLPKLPIVESWTWPAAEGYGGWGATWVRVKGFEPTV